jgi:hypothetical protein
MIDKFVSILFPLRTIWVQPPPPELPDDKRLCKGGLVILVGFPYILLAFEANPFEGDTNLPKGVRLAI